MSARRRSRARRAAAAPPPPPRAAERSRARLVGIAVAIAVLAAGAALRVWLVFNDDGIFWPDEIYQSLEPAHRLVFGQAIMPWEFILGARNWLFPGLVAALLKILDVVGLGEPRTYIDAVKLAFSLVGVATAFAAYRLARAYGASTLASAAGASLFALTSLAIYLAPRALSENASALPAALGLALVLPPGRSRRDRLAGSALLGLAAILRLQTAVFAAAVLAVLAWRRRTGDLRDAAAVLGACALLYGVLDQLTWGRLFASIPLYVGINLGTLDLKATFGSATVVTLPEWYYPPPWFYAQYLLRSIGVPLVVALALAAVGARRAADLAIVTAAFFVAHSFIPHKELRYVLPVLAPLGALAAVGIDDAVRLARGRAWAAPALAAVMLAASALSAATFRSLTFGDLGIQANRLVATPDEDLRVSKTPGASAYDDPGPVNRLLLVARTLPDLCGIKVESVLPEYQGGYTYLGRNVPLYRLGGPPRTSPFYNYAIVLGGTEAGAEVRATDGDMSLIRLRGACTRDPAFDARL